MGDAVMDAAASMQLVRKNLMGKNGLIKAVRQILVGPREPRLFSASSINASVANYVGADVEGNTGAVGFTWDEAAIGAAGECIERYCSAYCEIEKWIHASKNELGEGAIGMDAFGLYSPRQYAHPDFPFAQWDPDAKFYWIEGKSMLTGEQRFIPAPMVFIPYQVQDQENQSDFLGLSVSSGQACHSDPARALLSGICEVVERDAFMITWVRRIAPVRVDYLKDPWLNKIFERHFANTNVEFHVFDLTLDIKIPTMFCIAKARSDRGPFVCVGASTRPTEREAILKAIMEAAQGAVWARDLLAKKPDWRPEENYVNVRDFEDHVRLYCEPDMVKHVDFILDTPRTKEVQVDREDLLDPEKGLQYCLDEIKSHGLDVIETDITSPEIQSIGFYVPKVFVPGVATLTAVHGLPCYGSPRFTEVPEKLGFTDPIHKEYNPIPHPFP